MLTAASEHLSSRGHSDIFTAHFEFPSSTAIGPAIVVIEDVKLSQQLSRLHLTLWQGGLLSQAPWLTPSVSRRNVFAYTIHTNLRALKGITMPTGYEVASAAALPSPPNFEKLIANHVDDGWEKSKMPSFASRWRSLHNWAFYMPRGEPITPGVLDMWIRLESGERITQGALAYVVDSFPYNLHTFLVAPELPKLTKVSRDTPREDQRTNLIFPTLVMDLEVKTALPEVGVEWLAVRVMSKQIKNGAFDLDVLVRDVDGGIVALSHQVALIFPLGKNAGKSKATL